MPAAETRTDIVKKLAAQYAKKIKEQGRETPGLLRDEQLAFNLLLLVTKDAALKPEALEQARKDAAEAKPRAGDGTMPGPT